MKLILGHIIIVEQLNKIRGQEAQIRISLPNRKKRTSLNLQETVRTAIYCLSDADNVGKDDEDDEDADVAHK